MDATQRPIVFPPEFEHYAEKHNLFSLFEAYLERLVIARPDDPLHFLEETLSSPVTEIHKIIVIGPPVPERTFICEKLCEMLQAVHVSPNLLKGIRKPAQKKEGVKLKKVLLRFEKRVAKDRNKKYFATDTLDSRAKSSGLKYNQRAAKGKTKGSEEKDDIGDSKQQIEESKLEDLKEVVGETEHEDDEEFEDFQEFYEEDEGKYIKHEVEDAIEYSSPSGEEGDIEDFDDDEDFLRYAMERDVAQEEECSFETEVVSFPSEEMEEETPSPIDIEDEDVSVSFRERTPFVAKLMKRLSSQECTTKGWVMEGLPKTRLEALSLQQWAVFPTHVIFLEFENTPSSIEVEEIVNASNKEEWILYNEQIYGIEDCYNRYHCQTFLIDKPLDLLLMNVLNFTETKPPTNAPFTPRILLLGLPGSGKSTQAQRLAHTYDIVNIDFSEVVKHVLSLESKWDSDDQSVVDDLAAKAVAKRIHKRDALVRGYILHGFPSTLKQAEVLCEKIKYRMPNRIIVIEVSKLVSYQRLVYRRVDPFNRKFYHLLTDPPIEEDLFLFHRPQDEPSVVTTRINFYLKNIADLLQFFQGRITRIDGEMSVEDVSEALLAAIVQPPPNRDYDLLEDSGTEDD